MSAFLQNPATAAGGLGDHHHPATRSFEPATFLDAPAHGHDQDIADSSPSLGAEIEKLTIELRRLSGSVGPVDSAGPSVVLSDHVHGPTMTVPHQSSDRITSQDDLPQLHLPFHADGDADDDLSASMGLGLQLDDDGAAGDPSYRQVEHGQVEDVGTLARSSTAASGDTEHQAEILFRDFDGVHPAAINEDDGSKTPKPVASQTQTPSLPTEGLVYYPARIPRVLNLPGRISNRPSPEIDARRRTQVLDSMFPAKRQSTIQLGGPAGGTASSNVNSPPNNRRNTVNPASIPPQLRASLYFEHAAAPVEISVAGNSAVQTLDQMLVEASVAPSLSSQNKGHKKQPSSQSLGATPGGRKSVISAATDDHKGGRRKLVSRKSFQMGMLEAEAEAEAGRTQPGESDGEDEWREMTEDRRSRRSQIMDRSVVGRSTSREHATDDDRDPDEEDDDNEDDDDDESNGRVQYGAPATLLAELQIRKHELQQRKTNAATAFPNGMSATLLEIDAVAQEEKKRRMKQPIKLAWEVQGDDGDDDDDDDDDIPLGMLQAARQNKTVSPTKARLSSGSKLGLSIDRPAPLGLLAQKELDESEPLSKRRTRLYPNVPRRTSTIQPLAGEDFVEGGNETLAQRKHRLRAAEALTGAIAPVTNQPNKAEFSHSIFDQLGLADDGRTKSAAQSPAISPMIAQQEDEEESLGQRRARMQAEAMQGDDEPLGNFLIRMQQAGVNVSGMQQPIGMAAGPNYNQIMTLPGGALRSAQSLADMLKVNGGGKRNVAKQVTNEALLSVMPVNSLLRKNETSQVQQRRTILEYNRRSSMYLPSMAATTTPEGMGNVRQSGVPGSGVVGHAYRGGFRGGVYNDGTGGITGGPTGRSSTMVYNTDYSTFQPGGNMGQMNGGNGLGSIQLSSMAARSNPNLLNQGINPAVMARQSQYSLGLGVQGYQQMAGQGYPQMAAQGYQQVGVNGYPQMPIEGLDGQPLDVKQRDRINRWRQSVMP